MDNIHRQKSLAAGRSHKYIVQSNKMKLWSIHTDIRHLVIGFVCHKSTFFLDIANFVRAIDDFAFIIGPKVADIFYRD
jgi:hypothetical protein